MTYRTNPFKIADEHDAEVRQIETEAFAAVRKPSANYYKALPCPCGRCSHWLVSPVADIQGVSFSREQAEAVSDLLNNMLNAQ